MTFDLRLGRRAKEAGMNLAAANKSDLLERARTIAISIASRKGEVTADDVVAELGESLGNAAGSLFRGKQWRFTGRWRQSPRASNHAHQNRVWELQ
jgi:hypothetical protein